MIDQIDLSLTALSKAGRYYSQAALCERLATLDGDLYTDEYDEAYLLRTSRTTQHGAPTQTIVIKFIVVGETATVITQTTDHYDWGSLEQVTEPPFEFADEIEHRFDRKGYND